MSSNSPSAASDSARLRYDAFRAREIEYYKQVVPHRTLLRLADHARSRMHARGEFSLGDITLAYEVDDIIAERMRLPTFRVWERSAAAALHTPSLRGVVSARAAQLLLQTPQAFAPQSVVVMVQPRTSDAWSAFAGQGRQVVIVEPDRIERDAIAARANENGHTALVHTVPWHDVIQSSEPFASVILSPAACTDLADWEADELLDTLKSRTAHGGAHIIEGLFAERLALPRTMLRRHYGAWRPSVQRNRQEWTLVAQRPL